jgi:hypothetical protein
LVSAEVLTRFLEDLEKHINAVNEANKKRADDTLKAIRENYRQQISERWANELALAEQSRKIGDTFGDSHHSALAEVYKAIYGQSQE